MLTLVIPSNEKYNQETNEFIETPETIVCFEHSLVSVSKWESKWGVPFLAKIEKTNEQMLSYVECMVVSGNVVVEELHDDQMLKIKEYIDDRHSATITPKQTQKTGLKETITSELIYHWMVVLNIPFECENWHLNRLINLITICNIKNSPKKKMGRQELATQNRELNEARKQTMNTKG